jgi:hypothetical protein
MVCVVRVKAAGLRQNGFHFIGAASQNQKKSLLSYRNVALLRYRCCCEHTGDINDPTVAY